MSAPQISVSPSQEKHELLELPAELVLALHQSFERDELDDFVLDRAGAIRVEDILNQLIPDEEALSQTPLVSLLLRAKTQDLRMEVADLRTQLEQDQDPGKLSAVQEDIGVRVLRPAAYLPATVRLTPGFVAQDLLSQVTGIRDAATESEMVVRDITRDIQSLDLAKRNLIASMNALKRFQMLVNAFDQLTRLAKSRKYRETAQALGAVKQLSQFFSSFSSVDRVAAVGRGVTDVQTVLRAQIMKEFEDAFANEASRVGKTALLSEACLVIDVLGDDAKKSLLTWYSVLQLRDYRRIFASASEAGQLDNISRRFAWFRRVLKTHEDENSPIFPDAWNVGAVLAGGFAQVTSDDLKSVLSKTKTGAGLQVGLLLESLQHATEFERELARKYSMPFESITALSAINLGRSGLPATISLSFEPYLGIFVDAQDKILAEMIAGFTSSRVSISPSDNPSAVLPSSTELFYFYREVLDRCAKLSVRQPLLDLCKIYKKWLKVYAEDVLGGTLIKRERRSGEGRPNIAELQAACLVLNTGDYCLETASQLEERLKEKIHADLKDRIDLQIEKDIFVNTISASLLSILHELELSVESPFAQMLRSPWRDAEFVSSESIYVAELTKVIQTVVRVVREGVDQKKYVRSVCDKIVGLVLAKFTQTIVRCRPIAQIGAEQLLLDLQSLKACLLHLPLAAGDTAPVPMTYSRYVTKSILKVDTLLKAIMTPEEPSEEFVKNYLILIPCLAFSDFQKVLDLKGVRRADQNKLLDLFLARTSTAQGLSDTSFLTALDMDPGSQHIISPPTSGYSSPLSSVVGQSGASGVAGLSRAGTPSGLRTDDRGKEALQRLGARLGMAGRLFGAQ